MARIKYDDWTPKADTLVVIDQANDICREYRQQGYDLTLRQLYYQFVARALIPNNDRSYKRLGSIVNDARLAGLLDWSYITDRTRNVAGVWSYPTVEERIDALAHGYSVDHWTDQDFYVEVWVEKEALAGVVARAANQFDVPYFSCRGYVSQSELWSAAQRLRAKVEEGKTVVVLHLGDHDPSGIDMTRDITDRIEKFTAQDFLNAYPRECGGKVGAGGEVTTGVGAIHRAMAARTAHPDLPPIEVRRIALNMEQVEEYDPPPNPAKLTDSRGSGYVDLYGNQSWELDALDPQTLNDLITGEIEAMVDAELWEVHDEEEERERRRLQRIAARWHEIAAEIDAEGDE